MVKDITPQELREWLDTQVSVTLLDVREDHEFAEAHIEGSMHAPLSCWSCVDDIYETLPQGVPIVMICRAGSRSFQAAHRLSTCADEQIYNLKGGLIAWFKDNEK